MDSGVLSLQLSLPWSASFLELFTLADYPKFGTMHDQSGIGSCIHVKGGLERWKAPGSGKRSLGTWWTFSRVPTCSCSLGPKRSASRTTASASPTMLGAP